MRKKCFGQRKKYFLANLCQVRNARGVGLEMKGGGGSQIDKKKFFAFLDELGHLKHKIKYDTDL